MKYSQAVAGRTLVVRLEDGDSIHESLEKLAVRENVGCAVVTLVGGVDKGSRLVTGPADGRVAVIEPMETVLDNVYEATGNGTIFPDAAGKPVLHMHIACGRGVNTVTGCVRRGVRVWHVCEAVVTELTGTGARRLHDTATGFELLDPGV